MLPANGQLVLAAARIGQPEPGEDKAALCRHQWFPLAAAGATAMRLSAAIAAVMMRVSWSPYLAMGGLDRRRAGP